MVRVIILQQCHYCVARVIAVASASGGDVGDVMLRVLILQQCYYYIANSGSSSQHQWPCGSSRLETSNYPTVVLVLCSKSHNSSQCEWPTEREWPRGSSRSDTSNHPTVVFVLCCKSNVVWRCCLRCNATSNIPTVVVLLYCESHSSSQCRWRCCLSRGDTSDHLVALSYSKSNISSQRE